MRAPPTLQILAAACALVISSCAYPHPGPSLPDDGALPSDSGSAPKPASKGTAKPQSTASQSSSDDVAVATIPPKKKAKPTTTPAPAPNAGPIMMDAPDQPANQTEPPGGADGGADVDSGSGFDNVEVVDASLGKKLAIVRAGSQPGANNLLSVFVGLKNKTSHRLEIEVQTLYKDKAGNALNEGSWISMTLKPNEDTEYHSASISADAVDFLVRIRLPHTD